MDKSYERRTQQNKYKIYLISLHQTITVDGFPWQYLCTCEFPSIVRLNTGRVPVTTMPRPFKINIKQISHPNPDRQRESELRKRQNKILLEFIEFQEEIGLWSEIGLWLAITEEQRTDYHLTSFPHRQGTRASNECRKPNIKLSNQGNQGCECIIYHTSILTNVPLFSCSAGIPALVHSYCLIKHNIN